MKKVLASFLVFMIVFSLFSFTNKVFAVTTIFSDSFGSNTLGTDTDEISWNGWSNGGNTGSGSSGDDAEIRISTSGNDSASPDGDRFVVILGEDGYICQTIDTTGYENVKLSYYWRGDSDAESSDHGIVEYKSTGSSCSSGSFTELKNHDLNSDSSWTTQSAFDLPESLNDTTFKLKFRVNSSSDNEHFRVDGILITGDLIIPADTTPPVIASHADITIEATGSAGAVVSYTAPNVTDNVDATAPAVCTPSSGSTFPIGTNVVTCNKTDTAGNVATPKTFNVIVEDTTAPTVTAPTDLSSTEAENESGVVVTFESSATDIVDGSTSVICTPSSGSIFPIGVTSVDCSSIDSHGNTGHKIFNITVSDTTAPILAVPENFTIEATSSSGATVVFDASATDLVDGELGVSCTPSSGSTFSIGATTVSCSVSDSTENLNSDSFTVTVVDSTAPIITLIGESLITLFANDPYTDAGATAIDTVDGDLSSSIITVSNVDMGSIGTYTVSYNVTDSHENTATEVIRIIDVISGGGVHSKKSAPKIIEEEPNNSPTEEPTSGEVLGVNTETTSDTNIPKEEGKVLGESTCTGRYLAEYLFFNKKNNPEQVKLLQTFLNENLGLNLVVDGVYGKTTRDKVKAFQIKYSADILDPWKPFGLKEGRGTGNVYKTTRWKINNLMCEGSEPFPQIP